MDVGIITLFPEIFSSLQYGIPGRAQKQQLLSLQFWNPRDFAHDKHKTVDDRPYGGGPGMVMKIQPLQDAIQAAKSQLGQDTIVSLLSPQGSVFNQGTAETLAARTKMILVCGRYEGIDERLHDLEIDEEWSIGDVVLSGGEIPAMCIIDAVTRLLPGALGDPESAEQDSFGAGLLDHPHYTRPEKYAGLEVPDVLTSGDHQAIERWRLKQALGQTWLKRKDLLENHRLNAKEEVLLAEFVREYKKV